MNSLSKVFIMFLCFFSLACAEKNGNILYGPTCAAIDSYVLTYGELPATLSDVANYVEWSHWGTAVSDEDNEVGRHRFCEELRKSEEYYAYYIDSCLFSHQIKEGLEFLKLYSPEYLIRKRYPTLSHQEKIRLLQSFSPQFFNIENRPVYIPNDEINRIEELIKIRRKAFSKIVVRSDTETTEPFYFFFQMEKGKKTSIRSKDVPWSSLNLWSTEGCYPLDSLYVHDCPDIFFSHYLEALSLSISEVFERYPEINRAILGGPLYL